MYKDNLTCYSIRLDWTVKPNSNYPWNLLKSHIKILDDTNWDR
jgi:hypothetical protein